MQAGEGGALIVSSSGQRAPASCGVLRSSKGSVGLIASQKPTM